MVLGSNPDIIIMPSSDIQLVGGVVMTWGKKIGVVKLIWRWFGDFLYCYCWYSVFVQKQLLKDHGAVKNSEV